MQTLGSVSDVPLSGGTAATIVAAAVSGGGLLKLTELLVGRRRRDADATQVLTDAMRPIVEATAQIIGPFEESLRVMREHHAATIERIEGDRRREAAEMGQRISNLQEALVRLDAENRVLQQQLNGRTADAGPT